MTETRQRIYITGYPRSGNTWLGRLLADILGCEYNSFDGEAGDWPGDRTDAPWLVRKTHALDTPDLSRTIYIYRDPRDVAVSKMYYACKKSLRDAIQAMIGNSEMLGVGPYLSFSKAWWRQQRAAYVVEYGTLHAAPVPVLRGAIDAVTGLSLTDDVYTRAIERQSFEQARKRYNDPHHIRRGVPGDWVNHFTREDGRIVQEHWGDLMLDQGFIKEGTWWECLPESR